MRNTTTSPASSDLEAHRRAACPRRPSRARRRSTTIGIEREAPSAAGGRPPARTSCGAAGQERERVDVAVPVDDRPGLQLVVRRRRRTARRPAPRRGCTRRAPPVATMRMIPRTAKKRRDPRGVHRAEATGATSGSAAAGEQERAGERSATGARRPRPRGRPAPGAPPPRPTAARRPRGGTRSRGADRPRAARRACSAGARRRGRCAAPPSTNGPDSPLPQKPIASSHVIVMNEKPSYISASCTSVGLRSVRVHSCAPASRHAIVVRSSNWSQRRPAAQRGADRLDLDPRLAQVGRGVDARHDHRGRAVARHVAVVQAERASRSSGRRGSRPSSSGRV